MTIEEKFTNINEIQNKIEVQKIFYKLAKNYIYPSACLTTIGPDFIRQYDYLFDNVFKFKNLYIIERDKNILNIIKSSMDDYLAPYLTEKVSIIEKDFKDINDKYNVPFQEFDGMGTWEIDYSFFHKRLKYQSELDCKYKIFILTVTERSWKGKTKNYSFACINNLINLLGGDLRGFDGIKNGFDKILNISKNVKRMSYIFNHYPNWIKNGRIENLIVCRYSDCGPPLLTMEIIYK